MIKIKKLTDDQVLKEAVALIFNVDSKAPLDRWYRSGDSPLRTQLFAILCTDIPYSVCMQLRTHDKNGALFLIESGRPDTGSPRVQQETGNYREQPRNMYILCNAQHLIDWAHRRMCSKAEAPTRKFMQELKAELQQVDPGLSRQLVPLCVYRNGLCDMFNSCQHTKDRPDILYSGITLAGVTVTGGILDTPEASFIINKDTYGGIILNAVKRESVRRI